MNKYAIVALAITALVAEFVKTRFGLTSGRTLAYVKAGPAFGHINANYTNAAGTGSTANDSSFHAGLAAGAGLEYALTPNWILRGQYMHLYFENKDVAITINASVPFNGLTARYSATADIAQVGVSYKPWRGSDAIAESSAFAIGSYRVLPDRIPPAKKTEKLARVSSLRSARIGRWVAKSCAPCIQTVTPLSSTPTGPLRASPKFRALTAHPRPADQ